MSADIAYQSVDIATNLADASLRNDATGRGCEAFLRAVADVKCSDIQRDIDGHHIELCQAYLATMDGVSHWSARMGWSLCKKIVGWKEVSHAEARSRGLKVRRVQWGQRPGRHLILTDFQLAEIKRGFCQLTRNHRQRPQPAHTVSTDAEWVLSLRRLPMPSGGDFGARTVAERCPAHNDRSPSLVFWRNEDGATGGAQCMVCTNGDKPMTWFVRYEGSTAKLYKPKGRLRPCLSANHNNKNPNCLTGNSDGPVGGCVARASTGHYLSARLQPTGAPSDVRFSRQVSGTTTDPIRLLRWHESRSAGPAATDRAEYLAQLSNDSMKDSMWAPIGLCSVSTMRATRWNNHRPTAWAPSRQGWVLFDLDGIQNLTGIEGRGAANIAIAANRDKECTGRIAVVQTGPVGLQVWVELEHERHSPSAWHRLPSVRRWYKSLGSRMLDAVHKIGAIGGSIDMSSCSAGRFGRRPGWRVLSSQATRIFRSRLLLAVDKVKERIKVSSVRKRDTNSLNLQKRQAGSARCSPSSSRRLHVPAAPHRTEVRPGKNPSGIAGLMTQEHHTNPALTLPLIKSPALVRMEVLHWKPRPLALLCLGHDSNAARNQNIVGRSLARVNSKELTPLHRSENPHRCRGSDNCRSTLRLVSGVE